MGVRESKYVEQKKVSEVTQEVCFEGMKYTFKSRHHLTRHHPHIHTHTHTHRRARVPLPWPLWCGIYRNACQP